MIRNSILGVRTSGKVPVITQHVVFGTSAAGSVKTAFERLGLTENVVCIPDHLNFGPIRTLSSKLRKRWNRKELGYSREYANYGYSSDALWSEATRPDRLPIAWLHRRSAREYSNFLEFVSRLRGPYFKLVDLTDIELVFRNGKRGRSRSSGEFTPERIIEARFIDLQVDVREQEYNHYKMTWTRLKEENAPFRVIAEAGLISAEISYFDSLLISFIGEQWVKCARVVLDAEMSGPYAQTDSFVLWPRLCALVDCGLIEGSGKMIDMRESFVRNLAPTLLSGGNEQSSIPVT